MKTLKELQREHKFNTDKDQLSSHGWRGRTYLDAYDDILPSIWHLRGSVMEIGVLGGGSLKLWASYFHQSTRIVGVDIDPTRREIQNLLPHNVAIEIGSQSDAEFLNRVEQTHGPFKMILDDGSHVVQHMLASFRLLWPKLVSGGVYLMEDMRISYYGVDGNWPGMKHNPPQELAPNDRRHFNDFILDIIHKLDHHEGDVVKVEFHPMIVAIHKA